tara:strand:+ start:15066 stop:15368 length:303 start_codon:yes stop_codon:yes gene_type:complete
MNSFINRRMLLLSPITFIKPSTKQTNLIPKTLTENTRLNDNVSETVFVSNNKKFVHDIYYNDSDGCVEMKEIIAWYDPFTDKQMSKRNVTLYITETTETM